MKTRFLPSLVLFAVFLVSCAPPAATLSPEPTVVSPTAVVPTLDPGQPPLVVPEVPTETAVPTPLPVATSRGPDLHATDPTTIALASGGLQFVEFFRFT